MAEMDSLILVSLFDFHVSDAQSSYQYNLSASREIGSPFGGTPLIIRIRTISKISSCYHAWNGYRPIHQLDYYCPNT